MILTVAIDPCCPWIGSEIVAILTFDLCAGWKHVVDDDEECEGIVIECRSTDTANYLKTRIDSLLDATERPNGTIGGGTYLEGEPAPASIDRSVSKGPRATRPH